jgi:hypothetical protein
LFAVAQQTQIPKSGLRVRQPEQEESNRDRGIVELKRAEQAHFEQPKFVSLEPEIEPLPRCRERFARYADLIADKARRDRAIAVVFDEVRPQIPTRATPAHPAARSSMARIAEI